MNRNDKLILVFADKEKCFSYLHFPMIVFSRPQSATTSYEDLSVGEAVEMHHVQVEDTTTTTNMPSATTTFEDSGVSRGTLNSSMSSVGASRRLVRQSSVMDTQRDSDGSIKMTYWF